jgi:ADP-dependent NAD(P)H-hydrate dehydratase / NAD(P)H-hydrate epimerase
LQIPRSPLKGKSMQIFPSQSILTAAEMRAAEELVIGAGTSVATLMERAGAAVADTVWRYGGERPTLILCGPGNNGGDGYVAARLLQARGLDVRVAAIREPRAPAAIEARRGWTGPVEVLEDAIAAPVLVDALFGTGLARALEPSIAKPLARLASEAKFRIGVDLPSGVGTDDGAALGAVQVDLTLALGALKPAHLLQPSASLCGAVRVADIGVEAESRCWSLAKAQLSAPAPNAHKYSRGMVAVVGGAMGGASMLSAKSAMRIAGYVALVGARRTGPNALVHWRWEEVSEDHRVGALLIGPGLGRSDKARAALDLALASDHPLVLDADALTLLAEDGPDQLKARHRPVILTPHEGEFQRLFGTFSGSKIERARAAAAKSNAVVILKGADTVIAAPDGRTVVAPLASGWLASAGTGDVLAGITAGLLARVGDPFWAACDAVWLHSEAARLAGPGLIADDLPDYLPAAMERCL